MSNFDVDGKWFDQNGHIVDTSGQTFGFLDSSLKPKYATNFLGVNPADGGGGSSTFGETQAYKDIMAYLAEPESGSGNYFQGIDFSQFGSNSGPGPDLLSLVLSLAGVSPNAPANMVSLGIITSLFAPKDAWIAVANKDTMDEWSKGYFKFNVSSDGLFIDPVDPQGSKIKAITNPVTGKIILAPGLFDGKRSNYGLGDVIIHEGDHYNNWKKGILQGNHPLIQDMNEISAYKTAGQWTGKLDPGVGSYLQTINNYIFNLHMLIK